MSDLSKDEKIALALTSALLQALDGQMPTDGHIQIAHTAYRRMHKVIASSPESRAERGLRPG